MHSEYIYVQQSGTVKVKREAIAPDADSSFRILLTPNLNDLFYWHLHPEYEIVYAETAHGVRHIGNHVSRYEKSDLVFIGPYLPHLNFDYGVPDPCDQVVVQMKEDFLGKDFLELPELQQVKQLFDVGRGGIAFYGKTKLSVSNKLKQLSQSGHFKQLLLLLEIFQELAESNEYELLRERPTATASLLKTEQRMERVYRKIELAYNQKIDIAEVAAGCNLTVAAFCRYFKKTTGYTFTAFLNRYRINQAKRLLLHGKTVSEACFECGFEDLSYFNRVFKKLEPKGPRAFKEALLAPETRQP